MTCAPAIRPRNAIATREAILDAARARFSRHSFDDVGVRQIAADVGVDAALISRYFGSKDELFAAVLESCEMGDDLFDGPRESFGQRLADKVIDKPKTGSALQGMHIMLRSIGSPNAMAVVRANGNARFFDPFVQWLGGTYTQVRVQLVASLLMGLTISSELSGFEPTPEDRQVLRTQLAMLFQAIVDGPGQIV